jgi:hypothetical protein
MIDEVRIGGFGFITFRIADLEIGVKADRVATEKLPGIGGAP